MVNAVQFILKKISYGGSCGDSTVMHKRELRLKLGIGNLYYVEKHGISNQRC